MMEDIKTRKRSRKLEVSRAKKKSKKTRREWSPSMSSSDYSDSSYTYHRRSQRRKDSKRKIGRNQISDSVEPSSRRHKKQPSRRRDDVDKKKKGKKRHKSPIRRRVTGSKRRYSSISTSSGSSDSSSSYSSKSCSTCSSHSVNFGTKKKRLEKFRSHHPKKCLSHWEFKERKQRGCYAEPENKKCNACKKGANKLGRENLHKHNGKTSDKGKLVYSPEHDKARKRQRGHAEEGSRLSVHVENRKLHGLKESYDNASQISKSFSCIEKCERKEKVSDDAESKAEALELLLRQKALENLRKFRDCKLGIAEVPSAEKVEQKECLALREDDEVVSSGKCEGTRKYGKEEIEQDLWKPTTIDSVSEHSPVTVRGFEQPLKVTSTQRERNKAELEKSSAGEICTLPVPTSERSVASDLHADCGAIPACSTFKNDASRSDTVATSKKLTKDDINKPTTVVDKDSIVASVNLNNGHALENDMTKLEEPTVPMSPECAFETEIMSDKSADKVTSVHSLNNQISQAEMIKADEATAKISKSHASQTQMSKLDKSATQNSDNSTFQQKTMSVMRGGEMVKVSYKVYIPERAATLARRQLKR
eukprot:Gb_08506 [translate_table: standard]